MHLKKHACCVFRFSPKRRRPCFAGAGGDVGGTVREVVREVVRGVTTPRRQQAAGFPDFPEKDEKMSKKS